MNQIYVNKRLLFSTIIILLSIFTFVTSSYSQLGTRTEVKIPSIPGYITLKCDFHMHTVFSDGAVWPPIRAEEAWLEGLDAFAITEHIEYLPYEEDIPPNHNRAHEIVQSRVNELDLLYIKGAEITRHMPPGHFNAIFLNDVNPLDKEAYQDAIKAAMDQGAFIFWNHPGWRQPGGKSIWYSEHTELLETGWMHGIEVVNGDTYYPEAHQWCLEKKLTMLGNSDVHDPINMNYDFANGEHRPMTLVFVKEKTKRALKEALFARRTVVYSGNTLVGEQKFLQPIFDASIEIRTPEINISGDSKQNIQIYNRSDLNYELIADEENELVSFPANITLYADKTVLFRIQGKSTPISGKREVTLPYFVKNLLIKPEQGLPVDIKFMVNFE